MIDSVLKSVASFRRDDGEGWRQGQRALSAVARTVPAARRHARISRGHHRDLALISSSNLFALFSICYVRGRDTGCARTSSRWAKTCIALTFIVRRLGLAAMPGLGRYAHCEAGCSSSDAVTYPAYEELCITTGSVTHACRSAMRVLSNLWTQASAYLA